VGACLLRRSPAGRSLPGVGTRPEPGDRRVQLDQGPRAVRPAPPGRRTAPARPARGRRRCLLGPRASGPTGWAAFYHGTYEQLGAGDIIGPGYLAGGRGRHIHFASSAEDGSACAYDAIRALAEVAGADMSHLTPRVYQVWPGDYHPDPTPRGNRGRDGHDYRTSGLLRVIREVPYGYWPYPEQPVDCGGDRSAPCTACSDPGAYRPALATRGAQHNGRAAAPVSASPAAR
jgi:hypothetical protein